jgi:hypothetical protein
MASHELDHPRLLGRGGLPVRVVHGGDAKWRPDQRSDIDGGARVVDGLRVRAWSVCLPGPPGRLSAGGALSHERSQADAAVAHDHRRHAWLIFGSIAGEARTICRRAYGRR